MKGEIPHIGRKPDHSMKISKSKIIYAILILAALAGLGTGGYFYYQYQSNLPQNIARKNQNEAKQLTDQVGKLMLLPSNETPTIATVSDLSKLNGQQFFKSAKNGDKVLIYTGAKIAILYSPSSNKIINVGPVNVASQPNQTPQAKIGLRNGTDITGLAAKEQTNITNTFPGSTIVTTDQASNTNYAKTIIVVLNPIAKSAADVLVKYYNASISDLPSSETKPDGVDILIILGKDRATINASPTQTKSPTISPLPTKK